MFYVGSQAEGCDTYLLEYRGVEFLASVDAVVGDGWQLIQIHLPLSQEPHYVYRICDILVSTEL